MKRSFAWWSMLIGIAMTPTVFAQDSEPSASDADTPPVMQAPEKVPSVDETADKKTASEGVPTNDSKKGTPDVFVPSENISEDLAVSLPIDI